MKLQTIINKNANSSVDKKTRVLSCNFGEFMEMMDNCKGGYHSNDAHSRTFHGTDKMAKSFEASKELLWKEGGVFRKLSELQGMKGVGGKEE